jgi:hypothetical protein
MRQDVTLTFRGAERSGDRSSWCSRLEIRNKLYEIVSILYESYKNERWWEMIDPKNLVGRFRACGAGRKLPTRTEEEVLIADGGYVPLTNACVTQDAFFGPAHHIRDNRGGFDDTIVLKHDAGGEPLGCDLNHGVAHK